MVLGSGIRKKPIPDPGSRIQGSKRHRIPDPDPQHCKKEYFFLETCPQAHHLQSKKFNFLLTFCVKILFCRHYFRPPNNFMRKGNDLEPDPDLYLWLIDPNLGGPKTCRSRGSGSESKSPTLSATIWYCMDLDSRILTSDYGFGFWSRSGYGSGSRSYLTHYFSGIQYDKKVFFFFCWLFLPKVQIH